jgi:TPR repeat protein
MSGSVPLEVVLAWYNIRDVLLGQNYVKQNVANALELAGLCVHPDAVWLTNLFAEREVQSWEKAKVVLLGCGDDAKRLARSFVAVCYPYDSSTLREAANMGNAFAQAAMAGGEGISEERFRWAEKSASQNERDGFYSLGRCYEEGDGCQKDLERAKENYLVAANLGSVHAMCMCRSFYGKENPQRYVWMGKAASCRSSSLELSFLLEMMEQTCSGSLANKKVLFVIGRALKGQIDSHKREIFGSSFRFSGFFSSANNALGKYLKNKQNLKINFF